MSSRREPLWYCHECHAEMRPLMTPDPTCASCRGTFVEMLENSADDPRDLQNRTPTNSDFQNDLPGAFDDFLGSGPWPRNGNPPNSSPYRPRSPPTQRTQDNPPSSSGIRFEFHTGPGGSTTRTFYLGGSNNLRGSRSPPAEDDSVPTMLEFLRREEDPPNTNPSNTRPNGDITGPLMAQYLLAMFGGGRGARAPGDPFAELLGMPSSARWGDYVFNQEALDQILTQLAENSTGRPVPATANIIDDLPREVLTEDSPLLDKDCAVCKESFNVNPEDPDDSVIVTLPCKHPFHEGCILPWLKSSGTCPVCRHALVAQPQQNSPGGPSGGSSTSNRTNPSSSSRPRPSGNSDRSGASNLFHSIFGGGGSASGGNSDTSSRARRNLGRANRNTQPEAISQSTPPFPGRWIEDID